MRTSTCCSAPEWGDGIASGICSGCKCHANFEDTDQWEMLEPPPATTRQFSGPQLEIIEAILTDPERKQEP